MVRADVFSAGWHIFDTYFVDHRRAPFLASFKPTYRCNLRCLQCPFCELDREDIPFIEACGVLEQLYRRGNRLLILEGGEPMLWRDGRRTIHDIVLEAKRRFFFVGMTTNGTFPLDTGLDAVWVSIDGFADTHNRLRGPQVFERAMQHIRESRCHSTYAHITVNRQNADEIPELVGFLNRLVKGITIQFNYPYHGRTDLFLDFVRREQLLEKLIQMKRSGSNLMNSAASLERLKRNTWRCDDFLIDSANPDGSINQGCYLRGRSDIDCTRCGFSPHTELSLAYQGNLQAVMAGIRIFFRG